MREERNALVTRSRIADVSFSRYGARIRDTHVLVPRFSNFLRPNYHKEGNKNLRVTGYANRDGDGGGEERGRQGARNSHAGDISLASISCVSPGARRHIKDLIIRDGEPPLYLPRRLYFYFRLVHVESRGNRSG